MTPELIFYIINVISTIHCAQYESFNFRYQLSQPKRANYKRKTNITSHWMLEHHVSLHRALSGTCMRHDGFFFPPVPSHAGWSTIQNVGGFSLAQERTEFHCRVSHFNVTVRLMLHVMSAQDDLKLRYVVTICIQLSREYRKEQKL